MEFPSCVSHFTYSSSRVGTGSGGVLNRTRSGGGPGVALTIRQLKLMLIRLLTLSSPAVSAIGGT